MRQTSLIPAAMAAALLGLAAPSPLSAHARRFSNTDASARLVPARRHKAVHAAKRPHKSHRKSSLRGKHPHPKIYQDISGRVVLERLESPAVYGPFLPPVVYDHPRLPCEPIDTPIEARLHDPEVDAAPEGQAAELVEPAEPEPGPPPREPVGLARLAERVGSLFRPKSSAAVVKPQDVDLTELVSQAFEIPVEGVDAQKLKDSFLSSRGRHRKHLAIDIGAPRGTPIVATTDGEIVRIVREKKSGRAIYQKDLTGQYLLFYCHLSAYAENLAVGEKVKKGDVIGYVGSTGHVIGGPHLHFSITRVPDDAGSFKRGLAINPYLLFLAGVP